MTNAQKPWQYPNMVDNNSMDICHYPMPGKEEHDDRCEYDRTVCSLQNKMTMATVFNRSITTIENTPSQHGNLSTTDQPNKNSGYPLVASQWAVSNIYQWGAVNDEVLTFSTHAKIDKDLT